MERVSNTLIPIRRSGLRLYRLVRREFRHIDLTKPLHLVTIGILVATIVAPVTSLIITNERYRIASKYDAIIGKPSPKYKDKLTYDDEKKASVFNAGGQAEVASEAKDLLTNKIGAGDKKSTQLYSATLPDKPGRGIEVNDNVNKVKVSFSPLFDTLDGRKGDGRVVYPLSDLPGQMIYTPKANGLKEDIVLNSAPGDTAEFKYSMTVPDSLGVKLLKDGSLGFYSGSPDLFGNISYGTDHDRELVEKARKNADKNVLMFSIPAPVIKQSGSHGNTKTKAKFRFEQNTLIVDVVGLKKASYPLSIDPTFVLTTTTDFVLGSIDDNIDLSVADQVGRQTLVGGSTPGWTPNNAPSLTYAQFASGLVAYNGFLYLIGGGSGDATTNGGAGASGTTSNDVRYISLDPTTGALGGSAPVTWTNTGNALLNTARQGLVVFGFNGYLYAVGGQDNAGAAITSASNHTVEYAKINSNGTVGTWAYTTGQLNTARAYPAGGLYQGVIYVMGGTSGTNNATPQSTSEYARINGDGNISAWTQSTSLATGSLTSARSKFRGSTYNGFVYITGGQTNTTTVINTVEYAPILSNGALGAWATTTSFPTARRDMGMVINNGYIYVFAGCNSATQACPGFIADTQYAVINADGTVGQWQSTVPYNTGGFNARMPGGVTVFSNHLYFVGGCSTETATNNCGTQLVGTFITNIDGVGRFDRGLQSVQTTQPYNNNATTVARAGSQGVALNGYMYLIGGCSVVNCNTAASYSNAIEYAPINANGTLGTFATTSALISTSGGANNAGRIGHAVIAYNNKIYVIGGVERTTGNVDSYRSDTISATQASNGTLGTFTAETNTLPVARAFGAAVVWHNWIFYTGGLLNATTLATAATSVYHSQFTTTNSAGTWAVTTNQLTNIRWGHSIGLWGNWLYVLGGQSNTTGTYVTAATGLEQLTITNGGDITTASSVQNPTGQPLLRLAGGFVHNGYLYTFGGYVSGSTAASTVINWSRLDPTTGNLGAWSATNIGNNAATYGVATARGLTTAVSAGGYLYVMGGCTSTLVATSFSACSAFVTTANATEVSLPNNGGAGQTGTFAGTTALPAARADQSAVTYNGYLYEVGGCTAYTAGACNTELGEVRSVLINTDGTLDTTWNTLNPLPTSEVRSSAQAVAYNGFFYVIGGVTSSAGASRTVYVAPITTTGTLGTWVDNSANYLPVAQDRRNFGAAVSGGYMYVAGGENATGTKKNDVYYAPINSDGSLGTWNTTAAFTSTRSAFSLVAYNGNLYVVGGYDGTNALTDVQMGAAASNGTVASWAYVTDVASGMNARQATAANGFMYFFGDEGDATRVKYADINADGTLGTIQDSISKMSTSHPHAGTAYFNGNFYVTGGCTLTGVNCSGVVTTTEKTGQQAISRRGHYSKLFNTQVDTSPTQLVTNGLSSGPGSVVELKFQTASQANPVLGVAQLIRPVVFGTFYDVQALDTGGTNVGVAFNYLIQLVLDDSRSATFPDVNKTGFAQTAVTDITIYFHANPGRRLRHGASFTNTDCGLTPAFGCTLDTTP